MSQPNQDNASSDEAAVLRSRLREVDRNRIPKRTRNLVFVGLLTVVVGALLIGWMTFRPDDVARHFPSGSEEIMFIPSGRTLNIVVEEDGAYIGEEFIPFLLFDKYLKEHREQLRPRYVIVVGSENAKYGSAVQVFDSVRSILKVPSTIETRTVPVGTRREALEKKPAWSY